MCNTINNVMSSTAKATWPDSAPAPSDYPSLNWVIPVLQLAHHRFTDKYTKKGIPTASMRQKLSKKFDIRFYWMWDQIRQRQFGLIWWQSTLKIANYFTKHHPTWNPKKIWYDYLHKAKNCLTGALHPFSVWGCFTSSCSTTAPQKYLNRMTSFPAHKWHVRCGTYLYCIKDRHKY